MLDPRGQTLSAPASVEAEHNLSIVILFVSVMSVLGAGWIIASFMVISFFYIIAPM